MNTLTDRDNGGDDLFRSLSCCDIYLASNTNRRND
jgi:hypothetical protein